MAGDERATGVPLYFGLAAPFVRLLSADNPARGLNLFSAVGAAAAVGLLTWVVAAVTGSLAGGVAGGLLLAFSYTFWTQSVIAEVYALHLALVGVSLLALNAFAANPTRGAACHVLRRPMRSHSATICR